MSKLNIGIAGLGNVGSALVETIEENKNIMILLKIINLGMSLFPFFKFFLLYKMKNKN